MDQAVAHKIKWTDPEWPGGGLNLMMKLQQIEFISSDILIGAKPPAYLSLRISDKMGLDNHKKEFYNLY